MSTVESDTAPPEGWIPVERRWHGLDRTTIRPAIVVTVLAILLVLVVPAIDGAVPVPGTKIEAGQQVGLANDVVFTPAAGWVLTDGLVLGEPEAGGSYPATAAVTDRNVVLQLTTSEFDDTPTALLTRLRDQLKDGQKDVTFTGRVEAIRTQAGDRGVLQAFRSSTVNGLLVAFVIDGTGVEALASGPPDVNTAPATALVQMITSITRQEASR